MTFSLTELQKSYLEFIRSFIDKNASSPNLKLIAEHFKVKSPTAHKIVKTLQIKGYISSRTPGKKGFNIRIIEKAGLPDLIKDIDILGIFNELGEILEYPKIRGNLSYILPGSINDSFFGLIADENIYTLGILKGDVIIFNKNRKPHNNDVCMVTLGDKWFLLQINNIIYSKNKINSLDLDINNISNENKESINKIRIQWTSLGKDQEAINYIQRISNKLKINIGSISLREIHAVAANLSRQLPFPLE